MFNPAGLGKNLREFFLCNGFDIPQPIENNCPATGSPLIKSQDVLTHAKMIFTKIPFFPAWYKGNFEIKK
jgi:hypothetical protein